RLLPSSPGRGLPQFISVGYVDDQQFVQYDSDSKEMLPRIPWMRKVEKEDPQYWHTQTQKAQGHELWYRRNLQNLWNRYNQSGGIHTYQLMYGCELSSDGRKGGHYQYGYDGRDFIAFDKETLTWTAAEMEAEVTKRKWDPIMALNQRWLRRYLDYGKETLLRTGEGGSGEGRGAQWGSFPSSSLPPLNNLPFLTKQQTLLLVGETEISLGPWEEKGGHFRV
uniref:MHC class I-like antigen recognition-like domain-containing protein n=1 Tax=Podarcis muralis TaxID=64176 RepID=A0A670HM48_PODMU